MPDEEKVTEQSASILKNVAAAINSRGVSFDWNKEENLQRCYYLHDDGSGNLTEESLFDLASSLGKNPLADRISELIKTGNFFFYKKGEPEPFSIGLSDSSKTGIESYPAGSSYQMYEPQPLGFFQKLFNNWFGWFQAEADSYSSAKAAYDNYQQKQDLYQKFNEAKPKNGPGGVDYIERAEKIAAQKESVRSADISAVSGLEHDAEQISRKYAELKAIPANERTPEQAQFVQNAAMLSRPISAPLNRAEKLSLCSETDPQRIGNQILFNSQLGGNGGNQDQFITYLGDDKMMAEGLPVDGQATPADTKRYLEVMTRLNKAILLRRDGDSEKAQSILSKSDVTYLTDLCRTNLGIISGKLKDAGIREDTKYYKDAIPVKSQIAAQSVREKAEITCRIAHVLGACLPEDAPERIGLLAMRLRSQTFSSFCTEVVSPNSDRMTPSLAEKQTFSEKGSGNQMDAYSEVFKTGDTFTRDRYTNLSNELKEKLPQTSYQRLQNDAEKLSGEQAQRIAADLVVDVMKKDLQPGVNPRQVAESLAGRKDFQDMIGTDPKSIAAMAKSGDLLKKTGAMFSEEAQQKNPEAVSPSKVHVMENPGMSK